MGARQVPESPLALSPREEKKSRRRSCKYEVFAKRSTTDMGGDRTVLGKNRPLSFHIRLSSPDLKALAAGSAATDRPKCSPITQEEIEIEQEINNCDDELYAILLRLMLRENFYQRRLNIIIDNFMIPLTFDPWRNRIRPGEFKCIFRNIVHIRDFHLSVNRQLEDCKVNWKEQ